MTITQAIKWLQGIQRLHGDTEVYFDCPACGKSFKPTTVATKAIHLNGSEGP
jgi:uncharacterized C2H2 Zn-finger protein